MDDNGIRNLVNQFYELLKPGGVFFATMMDKTHYFSRHVTSTEGEISKVVLDGRLKLTTYVNLKDGKEVCSLFEPFERLHLGSYGHTAREGEGPTDHHLFVGRRRR